MYTDGSKINEKVGAAAVIKRLFQDGKTTRNLSKRLPDGSSIFSAEATAITLALDYYNAMPAVRHDVVIYSDSLSCLQAIQGEDTEHPLLCRIMNLLWKLNDKGTHVKFCWIPSHCGIEGNEAADKLAKESLGLNIDALLGIYHADLKPQVNAYVQQLMQVKWDVEVHGRDLYLLKANLAPPDRYKHLKRAEEVAMTRLRIGHCKATKGHIVSRGPPAVCHHCGSTLSREHILLECGTVQELRGEFYEADSLTSLFECVRPLAIIEYLKEAGFFYLIWQVYESEKININSHKPKNPDYHIIEEDKWIAENIQKCVGRLICPEGHVSSLNKINSIPFHIGPVHHDVVVYSDSMSCLQAIEGEDTENPFICHIMNLLWSLSDKGTRVRFCWIPSHCGIDGNERVDQLAKETLDQDIDPLASSHYTDMKPLVNSYIQKLVQTKWDVAVHGRDIYLVKPTLGPPKSFQHLTRAEEVVMTRLRIGHTKATKSHILSRGPPTGCHHCGRTLTIDHMLLECALLQECRDEY